MVWIANINCMGICKTNLFHDSWSKIIQTEIFKMEFSGEAMDNVSMRYVRCCDDCNNYFRTEHKHGRICHDCKKINHERKVMRNLGVIV